MVLQPILLKPYIIQIKQNPKFPAPRKYFGIRSQHEDSEPKKNSPKKGFCYWQFNIKFTIIISSIFSNHQPNTNKKTGWTKTTPTELRWILYKKTLWPFWTLVFLGGLLEAPDPVTPATEAPPFAAPPAPAVPWSFGAAACVRGWRRRCDLWGTGQREGESFIGWWLNHREHGGSLWMVPLVINPIYTPLYILGNYLLGISIYSLLKGYLEGVKQLGALHPKGTTIFHIVEDAYPNTWCMVYLPTFGALFLE